MLAATHEAPGVLLELLEALLAAGLVCRMEAGRDNRAWALDPARFYVTARTAVMRCAGSNRTLVVPEEEADLWRGVPCLDLGVQAVYERHAVEAPTWFGRLYRETVIRRLIAAEHTALLTRAERDRLQQRFSAPNPRPWEPNLLSATPTLELGIDVGDLSTVVLCSVPPGQANYLQRIGRAGRRDGNAFTATVAAGQPHDLYFYAEPLAMLAGRIEPPGVFLNAPAVLERQLTAFCLDGWAATGLPDDAVPRTIRHVLDNVEQGRLTGFPYPFLDFVQRRGQDLLEAFFDALAGELSDRSREYLTSFLQGDDEALLHGDDTGRPSLRLRMVNRFHEIARERKALRADVDALGRRIQALKRAPADEATKQEIERLTRERGGLQGLLRKLNGRETFNFLTDEGLLPNYAFPEAGVTLKSVIYRSREQDEEDADDEQGDGRNVYEYVRPAASALGELAPENEFYAGGNRVRIDRIDLRVSPIETWRLCPSCDYCARVDTQDDHVACPRCGDVMWSDAGQRREMLPLRMVHAATPDRRARILDERDDREPLFHTRQLAADVEPAAVKRACAMTASDAPFGFEYIESATFREMNFGRLGSGGQPTAFAGLALPRDGFRVCRRCGAVQRAGDDGAQHTSTCSARKAEQADIADCLYLYREFRSEAVQMLLPVLDTPGSEKRISSFVAALELGLRLHFSGRIDHLRATTRRSPRPAGAVGNPSHGEDVATAAPAAGAAPANGGAAHQYLLLYDTVPSGTGYLKELMTQPEKLLSVFEKARDALKGLRVQPGSPEGRLLPLRLRLPPQPRDGRDLQGHRHRDARPHPGPQGRAEGSAEPRRAHDQRDVRQRAGSALRRGAAPGRNGRRAGRAGACGSRPRQARLRIEGRRTHLLPGDAGRSGYVRWRGRAQPPGLPDPARPARSPAGPRWRSSRTVSSSIATRRTPTRSSAWPWSGPGFSSGRSRGTTWSSSSARRPTFPTCSPAPGRAATCCRCSTNWTPAGAPRGCDPGSPNRH